MEKETIKLLNVLRRISRAASYAGWAKSDVESVRFCVRQYNKVLIRLWELEPSTKSVFAPLADDASAEVVRIAARDVLAYFESDTPDLFAWSFGQPFGFGFGCYPRHWRRCHTAASGRCD
jgi:hypothetical protein